MKKIYRFLLLLFPLLPVCVKAQTWQARGALYEDRNILVEIEYNIPGKPCTPEGGARFRYHLTRKGHVSPFYISWRFDYFNCDYEIKSQYNTLFVNATTPAIVTPAENSFPAKQIVNYISYTHTSKKFPEDISNYQPSSIVSLEPRAILGRPEIAVGEKTLLRLQGGYLAKDAVWQWYEQDCEGTPLGTGPTLSVHPAQTTTYWVRAEGRNKTPCIPFEVKVAASTKVSSVHIEGPVEICAGKLLRLNVPVNSRANPMRWTWFRNHPGGSPIGEGASLELTPDLTTTYYVHGEGPYGTSADGSWTVKVDPVPDAAERIEGPVAARPFSSQTYSVIAIKPEVDAVWVWYQVIRGQFQRIRSGSSITIQLPASDMTIAVRAEGHCGNSAYTELPVAVRNPATNPVFPASAISTQPISKIATKRTRFYINGGVIVHDLQNLQKFSTYTAVIGGGNRVGWYLRGKFGTEQLKSSYQTMTGQIINYDQSGYYRYTGSHIPKRMALTGGISLGSSVIGIYLGGGYGDYRSLYQIGQYQYDNTFSGTAYVEDLSASQKGAEFEGGLLLRIGYFNLMGGVASVQGKYTDYHAGIGINF